MATLRWSPTGSPLWCSWSPDFHSLLRLRIRFSEMECCWCGKQWTCSRGRLLPFGNLKSVLRLDLQVGIGRHVSVCRSSAQLLDCKSATTRIGAEPPQCPPVLPGMPVRTTAQAPRTLHCAILRQYGPNKFAISALRSGHCVVKVRLIHSQQARIHHP
jgi:hypothetical protein